MAELRPSTPRSELESPIIYFKELEPTYTLPVAVTPTPPDGSVRHELIGWEKWYVRFVELAYLTQCLPVRYHSSEGVLRVTKDRFVKLLWFLRIIGLTLDNIYLIIISSKVTLESVGEKEFVDFWIHTISRVLGCIITWSFILDVQATCQMFNTMLATRRTWHQKFGQWGDDFYGPLEVLLRRTIQFCAIFFSIQGIFPLLMHLESRQSVRYWGSQVLPSWVYNSIPGIILAAANDFFLSHTTVNNAGYGITLIASFFVLMRFWTTNVMEKVKFFTLTSNTPLLQYRSLLVLNRIYNCCMGQSVVPAVVFSGFFMTAIVLSVLIQRNRQLPVVTSVDLILGICIMIVGIYFVLEGAGKMLMRSQDLKRIFKLEREIYRKKFVVSCRDMRMYVGQFYYVQAGTFINCMKWILDQAITIVFAI
ncbi:unnamed protein product [Orchesella dallaii]|uniref:Gustatory receptor n=1 Tax=Orchesella dallaii TaxID=48710 RepID=A0ABP1RFH4_9HEXA